MLSWMNILKLLCLDSYETFSLMGPGGFIPVALLPLRLILTLCMLGLLLRLPKDTFWSPCNRTATVVFTWLKWMMDDSFVLSKRDPLIKIISGIGYLFMSGSEVAFI